MILKRSDHLVSNEQKKKQQEERAGKVWRKLSREHIRYQETEDELRAALRQAGSTERA